MRALQWRAPGELELVDADPPRATEGQAVIEVRYCGICGSDLHAFNRGFAVVPGQVLGHEFCGTTLSAPGVAGAEPGLRVAVRPVIPLSDPALRPRPDGAMLPSPGTLTRTASRSPMRRRHSR